MPLFETLSLAPIALGVLAILRFVWLDSLRFASVDRPLVRSTDDSRVSPLTVQRLALQASADRRTEIDNLPKAA